MQKSRASFTVFFEDPFWVGVYEREEPGGLTACRVVFGAEPKDGEIYEWMLQNWAQLHFGPPLADVRRPRAENPKRARRMAGVPLPYKAWERRRSRRWHWRAVPANRPCRRAPGTGAGGPGAALCPARSAQEGKAQGQVKTCPCAFPDCRKR